jgi:hypothetical protein
LDSHPPWNNQHKPGSKFLCFGDQEKPFAIEGKVPVQIFDDQIGWWFFDFPMNGLFYDADLKVVIDPTGYGIEDARARNLRIPQPPAAASAAEARLKWVQKHDLMFRWYVEATCPLFAMLTPFCILAGTSSARADTKPPIQRTPSAWCSACSQCTAPHRLRKYRKHSERHSVKWPRRK